MSDTKDYNKAVEKFLTERIYGDGTRNLCEQYGYIDGSQLGSAFSRGFRAAVDVKSEEINPKFHDMQKLVESLRCKFDPEVLVELYNLIEKV